MSRNVVPRRAVRRVASLALLLIACSHDREILRLRPGEQVDLAHFDMHRQSLIIELNEGQVVPLDVVIDGDLASSPPGTSVPVTIKRHCFVRVDDRGMRVSDDGQDFDAKNRVPGSFQFGVGVTREGARATLHLTSPVR